ncbi:MAG: hypothetical protein GY821_06825 [Gammaproteobacteria bacterium]|nr:hypothetical protein [Gammaproteobacteria bacterium]
MLIAALIIVFIILILLPFLLAALHNRITKAALTIRYINYFIFIDVFIWGCLFTGVRTLIHGEGIAVDIGWNYSPIFVQYSIAVIALGLPGLFAPFADNKFKAAVCLSYGTFVLLSSISHIYEIGIHAIANVAGIWILISYYMITAIILLFMTYFSYFSVKQT